MLALDLINRLEELDDTAEIDVVLYIDRELRKYAVDSVAPDGTLVLIQTDRLVTPEVTDGVSLDYSQPEELPALQDDGAEDDPVGDRP